MKNKFAIILPLKENFSYKNFGAVSVWVYGYLSNTKIKNSVVYCRKLAINQKYLSKKKIPIKVDGKFYTNLNYIKKINNHLIKHKIKNVEIHNRPEYAKFLILNNPNINVNFIFHNDPNTIRYSKNTNDKLFLLENCNKIIFVSNWLKQRFFFNLNINHKNNTQVIYNFIKPIKKFPIKKLKEIIKFQGGAQPAKSFFSKNAHFLILKNSY